MPKLILQIPHSANEILNEFFGEEHHINQINRGIVIVEQSADKTKTLLIIHDS